MKNNKIILIVGGVIVLALVFMFLTSNKTTTNDQTIDNNPTTTQENTVFDSIRDAMSKSLSLKCEYPAGETMVTAYIKGNSIRIDSRGGEDNNTSAIMKDNQLWSWDDKKGEGIVMPLVQPDGEEKSDSEQIINDLEQQKQNCQPAVVADSVFVPPANIKFTDLSEMMKSLTGVATPE